MKYRENILQFGQGHGLLGVHAVPADRPPGDLCVIMLNAGLLHRVGPFRMHVLLARQLAEAGIQSLRLDLSGVGDSAPRRSGKSVQHNVMEDVRDAIALLKSNTQARRFVIMGLCSGAESAHHLGVHLPELAGLIMIDGILHKTRRYYVAHYLPRVFSLSKWKDWLLRRASMLSRESREAAKLLSAAYEIWNVPVPPADTVSEELQAIVDNDTEILAIFTGGLGYCSYQDQMRDAYPSVDFKDRLVTSFHEAADHTFSLAEHRTALFQVITSWLTERLADPSVEADQAPSQGAAA